MEKLVVCATLPLLRIQVKLSHIIRLQCGIVQEVKIFPVGSVCAGLWSFVVIWILHLKRRASVRNFSDNSK